MQRKVGLTLSIDPEVIRKAKTLAHRRGVSVSTLVEEQLGRLATGEPTDTPSVSELRGILPHGADAKGYRRHPEEKNVS